MPQHFPIARGIRYGLHVEGEPPLVGRFIRARLRNDLPWAPATLTVEFVLTFRSSEDLEDAESDTLLEQLVLEQLRGDPE